MINDHIFPVWISFTLAIQMLITHARLNKWKFRGFLDKCGNLTSCSFLLYQQSYSLKEQHMDVEYTQYYMVMRSFDHIYYIVSFSWNYTLYINGRYFFQLCSSCFTPLHWFIVALAFARFQIVGSIFILLLLLV